jgi:glycosyltransferase involved in cell wall biosynthesis
MNGKPLISIIVPVYNTLPYLETCVHSICAQTYSRIEIILVDDGSTDGSSALCDELAQRDMRIQVIHQPNAGQSAARNRGLIVATGECIGFVDSDDYIDKEMYQTLWDIMAAHDCDISACSFYVERMGRTVPRQDSGDVRIYTPKEAVVALIQGKEFFSYAWNKLYKRTVFGSILFPEGRIFEDLAIAYRICYRARKIVSQDKPLYHYCIHKGSSVYGNYNPKKDYQFFLATFEQASFAIEKGLYPEAVRYAMKRGFSSIEHTFMVPSSPATCELIKKVFGKLEAYRDASISQLGLALSMKRLLLYHFMPAYRPFYRLVRMKKVTH